MARAVAKWDAADLEEAVIAAKGAGGMARRNEEWAEHPQATAIAALPLLEIIRIGDSAPEPLPAAKRPLAVFGERATQVGPASRRVRSRTRMPERYSPTSWA